MENTILNQDYAKGGRVSSPGFRATLQSLDEPQGLPETFDGFELLILVKRVGKAFGFSASMIALLDHYISYTRPCDWRAGERPIVFQSLSKTAMQLGLTERQVQNLENALFEIGALTWNDSGNHRRFGWRDEQTGELVEAYGVDLTPLAKLKPAIEHRIAEVRAEQKAWQAAKQQISNCRRQIRAMLAEAQQRPCFHRQFSDWSAAYEAMAAIRIRVYHDVHRLQAMLADHRALYENIHSALRAYDGRQLMARIRELSLKISSTDAINFVPYKNTNQLQTNKLVPSNPPADRCLQADVPQPQRQEERAGDVADIDGSELYRATGLHHINLRQVIEAASPRFLTHLSMQRPNDTWDAVIDAAYALRPQLGIHNSAWLEACDILGRSGAAICLLITDQHAQRDVDPVRRPGGYFRSMIRKAKARELRLHASIFGILKSKGQVQN